MTDVTVICVDQDTDGDGYVSCTVSERRAVGDVKLHPIECAAVRQGCNANSGCRLPKNRVLTDQ